jgi:hypothetical protein
VTKVKDRLTVIEQRSHRFHMERVTLKKLTEVEGKEQYYVDASNMFSALSNLGAY